MLLIGICGSENLCIPHMAYDSTIPLTIQINAYLFRIPTHLFGGLPTDVYKAERTTYEPVTHQILWFILQ